MVKKRKHITVQRRGIAMIELIFSIVIMGIVLLSAPMLIQQSIRSSNVALQQEAIAAAASQISVILSMHWDENNSVLADSRILDVDRLPFDFDSVTAPVGIIGVTGRSSTHASGLTIQAIAEANLGSDIGEDSLNYDDVDDYDYNGSNDFGLVVFNTETTTADVGDYVDIDLTMRTLINYTEDRENTGVNTELALIGIGTTLNLNNNINSTPLGARSNIKFIRLTLSTTNPVAELNKSIVFQAFSCNIGTTSPQGASH